jgi:hypothetical protein
MVSSERPRRRPSTVGERIRIVINSWLKRWLKQAIASLDKVGTSSPHRSRRPAAPLALEELERRIVPTLLGQPLFPADYPTNNSIAGAPVSASSASWISAMAASRSHLIVNWGAYTPGSGGALYSMPYNIVHSKDTVNYTSVKVYLDNYPSESDLTGADPAQGNRPYVLVPMPKVNAQNLFIEGDSQNGPDPSRFTNGGSDSHLIVWDADTNKAYEFWEASRPNESSVVPAGYYRQAAIANQWNAANEATWNMAADSFRTLGYTSGDAAGLPILNNIVRPDEVLTSAHGGQSATPVINHALRFTLTRGLISGQFTYPASHVAAGSGSIPYGQRFRLKNDTATNALIAQMGPESQVIARALQQYGLILADIGSSMFVQGAATSVDASNNPIIDPTTGKPITWDMNDLLSGIGTLPTSSFEAVDLTPRVTSLSASSGTAGNTITITGVNFSGAAGHLSVLFAPPGNSPPYTSNGQVTTLNPGVVSASSVTIVDNQHLQVVVPSGSGTVDVRVLSGQLLDDTYNSDAENATAPIFGYGLSAITAADQFTYSSSPVAPTITTQPANQTVTAGQTATFTAAANGSPNPTAQWQLSTNGGSTWSNISGATAATYSVTNTITSQTGSEYRAVFTNSVGSATTNAATLTVNPVAPSITTQPANQTVTAGQTATFTAGAGGSPNPTAQWQLSTNGGATWSNISGATAATYSVTNTTVSQTGSEYRAVFTNSGGSATTNPATLTVNAATISGTVFHDYNTSGAQDPGEPGLAGQTVFLDLSGTGVWQPADPTAVTDVGGNYLLAVPSAGNYTVRQLLFGGVLLSAPAGNSHQVTVSSGANITGQNFADVLTSIAVPLSLPPTTIFPAQGNANSDYVEAVYRAILQRNADSTGLAFWAGALNKNTISRMQLVQAIWNSPEHFGLEVDALYQTILGRASDPSGRAFWVQQMQNHMPEEQVAFHFLDSPEYLSQGDKHFVDAMYQSLLGRPFDASGEAFWLSQLGDDASGNATHPATLTHEQVIADFLYSTESQQRLTEGYYEVFLLRPADAAGLNGWVGALQQGAPFSIIGEQFLASNEFYNRAALQG